MGGQPEYNPRPHARLPPIYLGVVDPTAERSFDVLAYFFNMLSMGVYTSRHWKASGRLVQESKDLLSMKIGIIIYAS